jgi:hypothetical protein
LDVGHSLRSYNLSDRKDKRFDVSAQTIIAVQKEIAESGQLLSGGVWVVR